jgi:hypothetical protein
LSEVAVIGFLLIQLINKEINLVLSTSMCSNQIQARPPATMVAKTASIVISKGK